MPAMMNRLLRPFVVVLLLLLISVAGAAASVEVDETYFGNYRLVAMENEQGQDVPVPTSFDDGTPVGPFILRIGHTGLKEEGFGVKGKLFCRYPYELSTTISNNLWTHAAISGSDNTVETSFLISTKMRPWPELSAAEGLVSGVLGTLSTIEKQNATTGTAGDDSLLLVLSSPEGVLTYEDTGETVTSKPASVLNQELRRCNKKKNGNNKPKSPTKNPPNQRPNPNRNPKKAPKSKQQRERQKARNEAKREKNRLRAKEKRERKKQMRQGRRNGQQEQGPPLDNDAIADSIFCSLFPC